MALFSQPKAKVTSTAPLPAPPAQVIPFPTARIRTPLLPADKHEIYHEIAARVGFRPAAVIRAEMLQFFTEEHIPLFDYQEVAHWLTMKKRQAGKSHWCWRPLRQQDVIEQFAWGRNGNLERAYHDDGYYQSNDTSCRPYELLVPADALEQVERIQKRFGDEVKFFVSDYADPHPDPFLMAIPAVPDFTNPASQSYFIFAVWNEPGFGLGG